MLSNRRHLKSQDRCSATVLCLGCFSKKQKEPIIRSTRLRVIGSASMRLALLYVSVYSTLPVGAKNAKFGKTLEQIVPKWGYLQIGSVWTVVCNSFTWITVSCLHFGQNSGKFSSTVSGRTLIRVLFPHTGHSTHLSLFKCATSISYRALDTLSRS